MQAKKKGYLNIVTGILGQVITIVCGILIPRLVMVNYGSEINGLITSISQILVYFSLFEAGIGTASVQALYGPVARDNREDIQGILVATKQFYLKTGLLYLGSVTLLSVIYPLILHTTIPFWKISLIIFFGGAGNCLNFFYQSKYTVLLCAEGKNYVCTSITTIISVLTSVAKVALLLLGFNVLAVQFSYFALCFVQMLFYYFYLHRHYSWIDWSVTPNKKAINQKNAMLVHQIAGIIFNNTDTLVLTIVTGDLKIVSVYSIYNMVISMITTFIQQLSTSLTFKLGQLFSTDREQFKVLHQVFEILFMTLAFAAMTTAYLLFPSFIGLYTNNVNDADYFGTYYPLLFVAIPLFTMGRLSLTNLINYSGHFKQTQSRAVIESAINLSISLVAVFYLGIYGVLLGSLVAVIYRTVDLIIYCYKHILMENPWKTIRRWIVSLAAFVLVLFFVPHSLFTVNNYWQLIGFCALIGVISLLGYFVIECLVSPRETKDVKNVIKEMIGL